MIDKVKLFYDKMGPNYDKWMETGESTLEDELSLVLITFPHPCRILDVGCGTGRISLPLQEKGYAVVGVDISNSMIASAKEKGLREAHVSDFLTFQYSPNSFEGIISLHAGFSYTNNNETMMTMLQKCRDFLIPQGRIIWDSPNEIFYGRERVLEWPTDKGNIIRTTCYGHEVSKLKELFTKAGFDIQRIFGSYSPLKIHDKNLPRLIIDAKNTQTKK